jgi:hypothetical protein
MAHHVPGAWAQIAEVIAEECVFFGSSNNPGLSYQDYLRSPEWAATRAEAIERGGGKCAVCSSTDELQVHHNTYDRLGYEDPTDLVVLCDQCHELFWAAGSLKGEAA